jgi:AraC-like DNA-binding protein
VFEGTERFEQPFTGIVFDSALMNAVSPHHDADMHSVLRSVAERRLLCLKERTPYAVRVREHLVKQGPRGRADMDAVARSLGMSARSLRRRLAMEGQTYERVADEAHAIMAKHLLTTTQLTLQETASTLGFSHMSTFHRAFKRWTGTTPLSYRAEQLRELPRSE